MAPVLARYPWLVLADGEGVAGYVYAGPHHARAAYDWSVDVTVYLHERAHRQGYGRRLYTALFELLRAQGFVTAFAGISLPNEASVGLHEALGFTPAGVFRDVGFKHGRWWDVGYWQLALTTPPEHPGELVPFPKLPADVVARALDR
jgi:phosphinothricin acetyltransferase